MACARLAAALLLVLGAARAQVAVRGVFPAGSHAKNMAGAAVPRVLLPPLSNAALRAREHRAELKAALRGAAGRTKPHRVGHAVPLPLDMATDGAWTVNDDGTARVWRLQIASESAHHLSLNFSAFHLPPGAELYVLGPDTVAGAFTAEMNNKADGLFAVAPVPGNEVTLEYWEPLGARSPARLAISSVVHGFAEIPGLRPAPDAHEKGGHDASRNTDSGNCHMDVACAEGNGLRDQINAVGMLITDKGQRICTGALVNNGAVDGRQLFLTANHCVFEQTTNYIVAFNHQKRACESAAMGFGHAKDAASAHEASGLQTVHGMRLLARGKASDYALFEILEAIPDAYRVYYAGWNRKKQQAERATCIHHPCGDYKKIAQFDGRTLLGAWSEAPDHFHFLIPAWSRGATERGSSGAPLFDASGLLVAHLHGGSSRCAAKPFGWDMCGALFADWAGISRFLDPQGRRIVRMGGAYFKSMRKLAVPADDVEHEEDEGLEVESTPVEPAAGVKEPEGVETDESVTLEISDSAENVDGAAEKSVVPENNGGSNEQVEAHSESPENSPHSDLQALSDAVAQEEVGNTADDLFESRPYKNDPDYEDSVAEADSFSDGELPADKLAALQSDDSDILSVSHAIESEQSDRPMIGAEYSDTPKRTAASDEKTESKAGDGNMNDTAQDAQALPSSAAVPAPQLEIAQIEVEFQRASRAQMRTGRVGIAIGA